MGEHAGSGHMAHGIKVKFKVLRIHVAWRGSVEAGRTEMFPGRVPREWFTLGLCSLCLVAFWEGALSKNDSAFRTGTCIIVCVTTGLVSS